MTHSFPTRRSSDLPARYPPPRSSLSVRSMRIGRWLLRSCAGSFHKRVQPDTENVASSIDVTVVDRSAIAALPFSYSKTCDTFRSEEHTSELQSLMRISYAYFSLTKNNT